MSTETTAPTCAHCGHGFTTQEGLAGEVLVTEDGMMHEHCGELADVEENQRRREHGDVLIEWKTTADLPAHGRNQANHYAWAFVTHGLAFPMFDAATAQQALTLAQVSIDTAPERGFAESIIEQAKDHFRDYWRRRLFALGLGDDPAFPEDPFDAG